jgi:phosphoglycolate phosphatase
MRLLIFDLDGTLIDSKKDIAVAVNKSREYLGLEPLDEALISHYVGNGAPELIRRALGSSATDEQVAQALQFFLAYYRAHKLDYTRLYPGVREALDEYRAAGYQQAVLTNKPTGISHALLDELGLTGHFFRIYGGDSFEKKPHPMGIRLLLAEAGTDARQTLMVGDSHVDVQTARNAAVAACGVRYGFHPETLAAERPELLIDEMGELTAFLRQRTAR